MHGPRNIRKRHFGHYPRGRKIKGSGGKFHYQRNGISGNGFYAVRLRDGNIATFEASDDGKIDLPSTRVIDPNNLEAKYRGDDIGYEIEHSKFWGKKVERDKNLKVEAARRRVDAHRSEPGDYKLLNPEWDGKP